MLALGAGRQLPQLFGMNPVVLLDGLQLPDRDAVEIHDRHARCDLELFSDFLGRLEVPRRWIKRHPPVLICTA